MTRTLEKWKAFIEHIGKENIADYLLIGDTITEDLIIHIRNYIPLETDKPNYLQLEEIQGYMFDLAGMLRPVYHTFSECDNQWRYHGICYKFETINRS